MYVVTMKSLITNETFSVLRNFSKEPCRFTDYATAQRTAHEKNLNIKNKEFAWVAKKDDGIYFDVSDINFEAGNEN